MVKIAVVGCTGNLGSSIVKTILNRNDVELGCAVARKGNQFVGKTVSGFLGGKCELKIIVDAVSGIYGRKFQYCPA